MRIGGFLSHLGSPQIIHVITPLQHRNLRCLGDPLWLKKPSTIIMTWICLKIKGPRIPMDYHILSSFWSYSYEILWNLPNIGSFFLWNDHFEVSPMTFRETPPPAFPRHRGWATGEIGNLLGGRGSSLQASGVPWIQASHGISWF